MWMYMKNLLKAQEVQEHKVQLIIPERNGP